MFLPEETMAIRSLSAATPHRKIFMRGAKL